MQEIFLFKKMITFLHRKECSLDLRVKSRFRSYFFLLYRLLCFCVYFLNIQLLVDRQGLGNHGRDVPSIAWQHQGVARLGQIAKCLDIVLSHGQVCRRGSFLRCESLSYGLNTLSSGLAGNDYGLSRSHCLVNQTSLLCFRCEDFSLLVTLSDVYFRSLRSNLYRLNNNNMKLDTHLHPLGLQDCCSLLPLRLHLHLHG